MSLVPTTSSSQVGVAGRRELLEDALRSDDGSTAEAVRLWEHTADAAIQWTQGLIERLEGGAYAMAGEEDALPAT